MSNKPTDSQLFQKLANDPAFGYTLERIVIAIAPLIEELADVEERLSKAKHLARLSQQDLERKDEDINTDFAVKLCEKLAGLTSRKEVKDLIKQHSGKSKTKLSDMKPKQLIALVRDVQYKLSYIKAIGPR